MSLDQATLTFAQWLISQGIGVAVAVAVLWLVGRKIDQQSSALGDLRTAIAQLTQAVSDHLGK
jgi:outer membrane murein-binding lipoprotein Lpp